MLANAHRLWQATATAPAAIVMRARDDRTWVVVVRRRPNGGTCAIVLDVPHAEDGLGAYVDWMRLAAEAQAFDLDDAVETPFVLVAPLTGTYRQLSTIADLPHTLRQRLVAAERDLSTGGQSSGGGGSSGSGSSGGSGGSGE